MSSRLRYAYQLSSLKSLPSQATKVLLNTADNTSFLSLLSKYIPSLSTLRDLKNLLVRLPPCPESSLYVEFDVDTSPLTTHSSLSDDAIMQLKRFDQPLVDIHPRTTVCYSLANCRVIGIYGIILNSNGQYVAETIKKRWFPIAMQRTIELFDAVAVFKQLLLALFPLESNEPLAHAFHFFNRGAYPNGNPQYGHFILENLPTLRTYLSLKSFLNDIHLPLLSSPITPPWYIDLLFLSGVSRNLLIHLQSPGLTISKLYFSSLFSAGSKDYQIDIPGRRWVHNTLSFNAACYAKQSFLSGPPIQQKVFLSRQHSINFQSSRLFGDTDRLLHLLQMQNSALLHCETITTFEEAGALFFARHLSGQFGSGLCKVMFMRKPLSITELYSSVEERLPPFYLMAFELGISYYRVFCNVDICSNWVVPDYLFGN